MTAVVIAAGAVGLALGFLVRRGNSGLSSVPLVLRILPAALLLLTAPAAGASLGMIHDFQQMAASRTANVQGAAKTSIAASRSLWYGSAVLMATLAATAAIQRRADARALRSPDPVTAGVGPNGFVSQWVPLLSPLALLPAGIIATQVHGVTTLIMEAGQVLTAGLPDQWVAGLTPAEVSATVSTRLLFTVGAGGLLSIGLLLLAGLNLFPLRSARPPFALAGYGWTVLGVVGLATGWLLIQLTADIRSFENFL